MHATCRRTWRPWTQSLPPTSSAACQSHASSSTACRHSSSAAALSSSQRRSLGSRHGHGKACGWAGAQYAVVAACLVLADLRWAVQEVQGDPHVSRRAGTSLKGSRCVQVHARGAACEQLFGVEEGDGGPWVPAQGAGGHAVRDPGARPEIPVGLRARVGVDQIIATRMLTGTRAGPVFAWPARAFMLAVSGQPRRQKRPCAHGSRLVCTAACQVHASWCTPVGAQGRMMRVVRAVS